MFCLGRICFVGYYSKFMRSLIALARVCSWSHGASAQARGSAIDAAMAANADRGVTAPRMNGIGAALPVPRFTTGDTAEPIGCKIVVESGVQPAVLDRLRSRDHDFVVRQQYPAMMGRGQAVLHNSTISGNFEASDPRADGAAEPEPIPLE